MKAFIPIVVFLAVAFFVIAAVRSSPFGGGGGPAAPANNVTTENGTQIVTIAARGGYSPRQSSAKAGVPTVIRMATNGTYDCSSFVSIPSLGVRQALPASGSTDFQVPAQQPGTRLQGMCGMGMYRFEVDFE